MKALIGLLLLAITVTGCSYLKTRMHSSKEPKIITELPCENPENCKKD